MVELINHVSESEREWPHDIWPQTVLAHLRPRLVPHVLSQGGQCSVSRSKFANTCIQARNEIEMEDHSSQGTHSRDHTISFVSDKVKMMMRTTTVM